MLCCLAGTSWVKRFPELGFIRRGIKGQREKWKRKVLCSQGWAVEGTWTLELEDPILPVLSVSPAVRQGQSMGFMVHVNPSQ